MNLPAYRHLPISRQIILVSTLMLMLLFGAMTWIATYLSASYAMSGVEQSLSQQVKTVRAMIDGYVDNAKPRGGVLSETDLAQLREALGSIVSGQTGYVYILSPTGNEASLAEFILHPRHQGRMVGDLNNQGVAAAVRQILNKKQGVVRYDYPDKQGVLRQKIVALETSAKTGWVIGLGSWESEYAEESKQLRNVLVVVGCVAAILAALIMAGLVSSRLKLLTAVIGMVGRMGRGDFGYRSSLEGSSIESKNEVLYLAAVVEATQAQIRQLMNGVLVTSERVGRSADEVRQGMQQMQGSAERESEAAATMATTMEQIAASVTLVAENAQMVVGGTESSRETVHTGVSLMARTVSEMGKISTEVQESAVLLASLGERSGQISGVVAVIREIAEQTNLLALNAAIEAARAGEQGRGFAVVADEVRKLAERTALSTHEISGTVQAIVTETRSVVEQMENVRIEMGKGVVLVEDASAALNIINARADQTLREVNEIAHAAQEQSIAVQALVKHVEQVASLSGENRVVATQNLEQTVALHAAADEMQQSLSNFKV